MLGLKILELSIFFSICRVLVYQELWVDVPVTISFCITTNLSCSIVISKICMSWFTIFLTTIVLDS